MSALNIGEARRGPQVGDDAPDFTVKGTSGDTIRLSDLRGKQRALLIFYPQDQTSGCRTQLSAARDASSDLAALDTVVFGVNEAGPESHQRFIEELDLPFDLLVDDRFGMAAAYGALKPEGNRIERTVVIVGKNGKVIFRAPGTPTTEVLLEAIRNADDAA